LALVLIALSGCDGRPKTYAVKGKLAFENEKIKLLAGSALVCQQQQEPYLQAQGEVQEDGSFKLQTLWNGEILPGAPAGTYRAWLHLSTENGSTERQLRAIGIDRRYLDGKASVLMFTVPSKEDVFLTVTESQPEEDLPVPPPTWAAFPRCGEPADDDGPVP